jgi:hypothetical protein
MNTDDPDSDLEKKLKEDNVQKIQTIIKNAQDHVKKCVSGYNKSSYKHDIPVAPEYISNVKDEMDSSWEDANKKVKQETQKVLKIMSDTVDKHFTPQK